MKNTKKIVMIDNYDSFTYNLVLLFEELGASVTTFRNDHIGATDCIAIAPDGIVISPGPGNPFNSGNSIDIINRITGKIPLLGICLGMQCINQAFGGITCHAPLPVHGKTSAIVHNGDGLLKGVISPIHVARYHSLMVANIPDCLTVNAWADDNVPMSLSHKDQPIWGLQFHPESFMTDQGNAIINNFLNFI